MRKFTLWRQWIKGRGLFPAGLDGLTIPAATRQGADDAFCAILRGCGFTVRRDKKLGGGQWTYGDLRGCWGCLPTAMLLPDDIMGHPIGSN